MKKLAIKSLAALLAVGLLGTAAIGEAQAHGRGHIGIGVMVGPSWGPWYYPPAYYYPPYYPSYPAYPPVVVTPPTPPVYVEQPAAAPAAANNYWYYCTAAKGYYPYVKTCPEGWQRVAPQPPQ